jgi:hypothetical protein
MLALLAIGNWFYIYRQPGRWFSPGTPTSSTTKTGRHDLAEILQIVALTTKNHSKSTD